MAHMVVASALAALAGAVPASVDWRHAVPPVANQGAIPASRLHRSPIAPIARVPRDPRPRQTKKASAGGDFFADVFAVGAAYGIATGREVPELSIQEVVDCAGNGTAGCSGGPAGGVFAFAKESGMCSAADYPTRGARGQCRKASCTPVVPAGAIKAVVK
eukprot:gene10270-9072_t